MSGTPKKRAKRQSAAQARAAAEEEAAARALEREERLAIVIDLLLAGADDRLLQRAARDEGWQLEPADVAAIITDARAEVLAAAGEGTRDDHVRMQLAKIRSLYRRALRINDVRTAAKLLDDERLLLGLQRADRGAEAAAPARPRPSWHEPPASE